MHTVALLVSADPETVPIVVPPPSPLPRHRRRIGEGDGVAAIATAVAWSEHEAHNRRAGLVGKHRRAD